jgi:putative Ca2+/H+ antiporter (TMEM165/GDT1 family)
MIDWKLFFSIFSLIFVAELPDKTALATLMMATQGSPVAIFIGVAAAFVIQSLVAIAFGGVIGLLPEKWVHLGSGLLFFVFAALLYFEKEEQDETGKAISSVTPLSSLKMIWKAFVLIFIAEWGDLTQLATASMAARNHSQIWTVFTAAVLSLWTVTAIAIFVGHQLRHTLPIHKLKILSMALFTGIGIYFISKWFLA